MQVLVSLTAGRRSRVPRRVAIVIALAVAVIIVAAVLVTVRATATERLQHWALACQSRGGFVAPIPPETGNPLIVQSPATTDECRATNGHLIESWR